MVDKDLRNKKRQFRNILDMVSAFGVTMHYRGTAKTEEESIRIAKVS